MSRNARNPGRTFSRRARALFERRSSGTRLQRARSVVTFIFTPLFCDGLLQRAFARRAIAGVPNSGEFKGKASTEIAQRDSRSPPLLPRPITDRFSIQLHRSPKRRTKRRIKSRSDYRIINHAQDAKYIIVVPLFFGGFTISREEIDG